MRRRDFIAGAGCAVLAPLATRAQAAMPVIAFLNGARPEAEHAAAFRKGLSETGFIEGRNIAVEYRWFDGQYGRVQNEVAELVHRQIAVIVTPGFPSGALAAKAATTTIPIVFGVGDDPVKLGLVASIARPGGNITGVNFLVHEVVTKRLGLLRELIPQAARIAVMVNPANVSATEATVREARETAPKLGMQLVVLNASTPAEIDAAFAAMARERVDGLLVGGDGFLNGRRGQFATLAARDRMPMIAATREAAQAGSLMSYGASVPDMFRQVGVYAGSIIKGARPAELPVLQSTKLVFVINLQTAKALGLEVPPTLLARADEVIE